MEEHVMNDNSTMSMSMTFNLNTDVKLLFDFWHPQNELALFGSCVIIFLMAFAFEALKAFRENLYVRAKMNSTNSDLSELTSEGASWRAAVLKPAHSIQTLLYMVQVALGNLLMLLFMSFNGFVAITIVLGSTLGFFVFGWAKFMVLDIAADHCN